ncbi:MAG: hypothetical protein FJZ98_06655 [Chloroflexi bacterium]|nr:hypothetical protein [Chloroflexota bacterium]
MSVEIDEITLEGTVADYSADRLTVMTINGQEFFVENRAWWFAQQAGFAVNIGDRIELSGFFDESGFFEVSQLMNLINGININIRDESGRPYWAGNGGGGGQGRRSG